VNEYLLAFTLGLLSTPHCVAMCGSLVGAMLMGSRSSGSKQSPLMTVFLFGSGKLLAYVALGAIAGLGGLALAGTLAGPGVFLRALSALLMIGIGLYIAGWWRGIARLEKAGARLWQPLLRRVRVLRLDKPGNQLLAGMAWGLLPCGIVYSMLGMALASADMLRGSLLMASFGLGTMPFVMSAGGLMKTVQNMFDNALVRQLAGGAMIVMGLAALLMLGMPAEHVH
jgi:sulfite exporter TauE/SafE